MTVLAAAAGLAAFRWLEHRGRGAALGGACCLGLLVAAPLLGAAVAAVACLVVVRGRLRSKRLAAVAADADVVLLADLVALGLRAGLSLIQALDRAAREVVPELAAEVGGVIRSAGRAGTAAALAVAEGRAERLYRLAARATATGAPLADAVEAFAAERRHADHARAVEAARRLPVRMLIPLALLILPGFVVLAVGPALLEALERLQLAP